MKYDEVKPIREETLAKIWEKVGLTHNQIVSLGRGQPLKAAPPKVLKAKNRSACLICGQPIGKNTCKPWKQL